ncbi:MAG: universal stress protein [Armatimonadetes bacterium]|nr:universal stress protein [Armatimonadota bacterium]
MLQLSKIVCPTDFSDPAMAALAMAKGLAKQFGAKLYLIHVVPPIPLAPASIGFETALYEDELRKSAEEEMKKLVQELRSQGIEAEGKTVRGEPCDQIVEHAKEVAADMIVIATHGHTGWKHVLFGSVAEKVVRLAGCPVLSFRPNAH